MHCYPGASDIVPTVSANDLITSASTSPHSDARRALEDASGLSPFDTSTLSTGSVWER